MKSEVSFEDAIIRLESIVEELEDGTNSLDYVVELFEEGSLLVKQCNQYLREVEQKIEILNTKLSENIEGEVPEAGNDNS
ncbi:MAG: exodeoxyribonuclease VII small subunit [Candidatus Cloacimonetes bacterium]|nr:exodeoxyribonuclease VII small subunit [Candidatus Cloacimonadota bacterium]